MGIDFTHVNGARGKKWMPETMGGGVAVLDYDGDGKPDLLFVSGAYWPGDDRRAGAEVLPRPLPQRGQRAPTACRTSATSRARRGSSGSSTAWAPPSPTTTTTGATTSTSRRSTATSSSTTWAAASRRSPRRPASRDSGWGTSSAWLDYDGDGLLDLFVCRYVDWSPEKDLFCTLDGKTKSYCTPGALPRHAPRTSTATLGGGRFEDVTNEGGHRERQPEGARRRALGLRRRRPHRPPRRQRHGAQQPLPQPGRRTSSRTWRSRRASPWTRPGARAARWARPGPTPRTARASRSRSATSRTSSSPSTGPRRARSSSTSRRGAASGRRRFST